MAQNLKRYEILCPNCEGGNFSRATQLSYGPNGMTERTGDYICLECNQKLGLDQAVRRVELLKKQDELDLMRQEMESMSA